MYNILVCDDEKDIVEALGIYPVSYTHLDVYKRQGCDGDGAADCRAERRTETIRW